VINCVLIFQSLSVTKIASLSFSSLVDFVIPAKDQSLLEAYNQWRERADAKVCCDYGLHAAITSWNEQVAKDMEILTKEKGFLFFF
jgi:dihydropyrimidinase